MSYRAYVWRKENPERRAEQKRREKERARLRRLGILPPVGHDMDEEESRINDLISNNDFSYRDEKGLVGGKIYSRNQKHKIIPKKTSEYLIWYRAKSNAKKRGIEFDLDLGDIFVPQRCPYLNIELSTDFKDCGEPNYFSIDRIDSTKGYVKGNVQVISKLANTMKNNASKEQLVVFAESILKLYK